jgi:opacity protein-like surface antigen
MSGVSRIVVGVSVAWLAAGVPAFAQDNKQVNLLVGVGFTVPQAEVRQDFGTGYNFDVGIVFNIKRYLGVQLDYNYNGFGSRKVDLPGETPTRVDLKHNMQAALFDIVFRVGPRRGHVGLYGLGGPGVYTRRVSLTTPGTGTLPGFCDPYWYVCYPPVEVPVEDVVGAHRSTDLGFNVGGGINIRPGGGIVIFIEARYHRMRGPEYTLQNGTTQQASGWYAPITFGLRF